MTLEEFKKLEQNATPGVWEKACRTVITYTQSGLEIDIPDSESDAAFIAASRMMVPRLIKALELARQCAPLKIDNQIKKIISGEKDG